MSTSEARAAALTTSLDRAKANDAPREGGGVSSDRERETAQYIADMILELRNMAKAVKLFQVLVPLEYAYYEAFSVANRVEVPAGEADRLRNLSYAADDTEQIQEDY